VSLRAKRASVSVDALRRGVARLVVAAVALGAGTVVTAVAPDAAYADSAYSMESQFVAKMNAARQSAGLRPYSVAYDLTSVARQHSQAMASRQTLYHNPTLTSDVHNWQAVGENVGDGPTVSDIHTAFMNSPEHRANILDHDFTQVGVGVSVDKNGIIWVTEDFRQPMGSTSTSTPSTSTAPHHSAPAATSAPRAGTVVTRGATTSSAAPAPRPSPRQVLLQRLRALRHHHGHAAPDPVAQGFAYANTLARLAG
jgi:uncharacterized protein YkwD